jgi:hypothetical protein
MEENLNGSGKNGKPRTGNAGRVALTPGQALEILQQAVLECQAAGLEVQIYQDQHEGRPVAYIVVLANVLVIDGNLKPSEN